MHYQQIIITIPEQYADALSDALMDHGALSTAIEDARAGTADEQPIFGEPGLPTNKKWLISNIISLFDEKTDVDTALTAAAQDIGIPKPSYKIEKILDQDWVRLTQSQFNPIQVSERLWITPSWHAIPKNHDIINLQLDPGLAFGTGSHPTTLLCLRWLDTHIHGGEQVLDYGCGSGILTIAAMKLGARMAYGVDIDPQAIEASKNNAQQNHIDAQFFMPDELPEAQFDVVLANILANPLRLLGHMLAARTKTGGQIVLSGILQEQLPELTNIYSQWFDLNEPLFEQGWVCISGYKRDTINTDSSK